MTAYLETLKAAVLLRLQSLLAMPNTKLLKSRRFGFLGLICAAALLAMILKPNASGLPAAEQEKAGKVTAAAKPDIDITRYDAYLEDGSAGRFTTRRIDIKSGDSLGPLLQEHGVSPGEAYKITQRFSDVYDPRYVKVGHSFNFIYADDQIKDIVYKPNIDRTIFVERQNNNDFAARDITAEFKFDRVTVRSKIENSLYLDANRLGAPDKVIQQFANIYEYSVDFQRDIQPGDEFEMFFEVARDHRGNIIKAGDLLYTSFSPRGKTSSYYLFEDEKGRENFYDEAGKTAKRKLRATPVNGARLSGRFGKRKHPILGYVRSHKGVDFAAPRGTPILAAGSGTVERANRYGSFGNYIRIRHTDGYKTAYAHLSKFARGVKAGARVKQDQVIGYVGTTGRSTGPHLHYEVHHHGKAINPRRLSQLSGKPLAKSQFPAFKALQAKIDDMRRAAPVLTAAPQQSAAVLSQSAPH